MALEFVLTQLVNRTLLWEYGAANHSLYLRTWLQWRVVFVPGTNITQQQLKPSDFFKTLSQML